MPFLPHVRPDHDETLVARLAADDLAPRELEAARAQVADCPACAELLADLRSIASATAQLPAPRPTRDFRLTEADAARLRPAGWRGLLARLGSPGFAFAKPLAGGLAALGIVGLILASFPAGFGAGSASGSLPGTGGNSAAGGAETSRALAPAYVPNASGAGPLAATSNPIAAPAASSGVGVTEDGGYGAKGGSSGPEVAAASSATDQAAAADLSVGRDQVAAVEPPSALLVLSVVLLVAAVVLGALRLIGRRLA